MERGDGAEILAADDVGDRLRRVVNDDRQMVGNTEIFSRQHRVAELGGEAGVEPPGAGVPGADLMPGEGAGLGEGGAEVEAERGACLGQELPAASAWIDWAFRAFLRGGEGDVAAGAAAGVEEAEGAQAVEGGGVGGGAGGLAQRRLGPGQAEPAKILDEAGLEFRAAATAVNVFYSQEKFAALGARQIGGDKRGEGVAEMEAPRRGRGETGAQVSVRRG